MKYIRWLLGSIYGLTVGIVGLTTLLPFVKIGRYINSPSQTILDKVILFAWTPIAVPLGAVLGVLHGIMYGFQVAHHTGVAFYSQGIIPGLKFPFASSYSIITQDYANVLPEQELKKILDKSFISPEQQKEQQKQQLLQQSISTSKKVRAAIEKVECKGQEISGILSVIAGYSVSANHEIDEKEINFIEKKVYAQHRPSKEHRYSFSNFFNWFRKEPIARSPKSELGDYAQLQDEDAVQDLSP
jgi:hypothetical protein